MRDVIRQTFMSGAFVKEDGRMIGEQWERGRIRLWIDGRHYIAIIDVHVDGVSGFDKPIIVDWWEE
jgi:hypothetical protein